jgi:hypothetical protein
MCDSKAKRIAIMQPYFLPYVGYFQLICASDVFVFYDDVNFIKKGWLRRNRIRSNNRELLISLPCNGVSQNKLIKDVQVATELREFRELHKLILNSYQKAPYYHSVSSLVDEIFDINNCTVSEFNIRCILSVMSYLDIPFEYVLSSEFCPETRGMSREERILTITKLLNGSNYINLPGGRELYDIQSFKNEGVELEFLEVIIPSCVLLENSREQMNLSIIDLLMHCSKPQICEYIKALDNARP